MFSFLKKKGGIPDVGQEEIFDKKAKEEKSSIKSKLIKKIAVKKPAKETDKKREDNDENSGEKPVGSLYGIEDAGKPLPSESKVKKTTSALNSGIINENYKLEFSKVNAKIESLSSLIKGYNERFSNISQQIGEVRAMNLSNEKSVSKMSLEGKKAADIVKEVKPEQLRIDYQKVDAKVSMLNEKIEGNKQFMETIMNEIKDLRRKAGIFVGTDALLNLNEEVKNDLVEIQKVSSRVRLNADKSEELFIELKRGFSENEKLNGVFNNLDNAYSGLQKEVGKLKVDFSNIVKNSDFTSFKKQIQDRILSSENSLSKIEKMKEENERLAGLIETILSISKKNEDDIAEIAVSIGDENIDAVKDYDEKFSLMLKIIDEITSEVKNLKGKIQTKNAKKPGKKTEISNKITSGNLLGISGKKINKWKNKEKVKAPVKESNEKKPAKTPPTTDKNENFKKEEQNKEDKPEEESKVIPENNKGKDKFQRIEEIKKRMLDLMNVKKKFKAIKKDYQEKNSVKKKEIKKYKKSPEKNDKKVMLQKV